ncbi:MAG TPA: class I SAM-dependent methyltransferase [Kofleriaceae bacterium]|jgi:SAM-dependent methyltransferase
MTTDTSKRTLRHYEVSAESFWEGTRDHDVSQNIDAFLAAITESPPSRILELGCGPGRDLKTFVARGHQPVGLDGCARFVEMARTLSGCEVWLQDFLELDLPPAQFHGVFANASLFHVPSEHLPRVLSELRETLKPGGVLFFSNPRGENQEGWSGERYGCYFDIERWRALVTDAGFREIDHYYRPTGRPRSEQPWLAMTWRRGG